MPFLQFLRENAPFLAVGALLTFSSGFGQTFFISVFAGDIREAFGLSHGAWGALYAAATTTSALVMLWSGALTDRYRVRQLGAVVLCGLAASCLVMAASPAAWALAIAIFGLRFFGQGMAGHTALVAMARWFVATRGRAISIASGGFALAEAVLPLTFVALLGVISWRALWVLAAFLAIAALPVVVRLLAMERTPQQVAADTQAVGMDSRHWTRRQVLGHRLFWLTLPAQLAVPCFGTAFFFQQVHLAEVKGWPHVQLVALFPLYTAVSIATVLGVGWAIDRFGTARLVPIYLLPMAGAFALLGPVGTIAGVAVCMSLMAVTHGSGQALLAAFWAEFYGTRHMGAIRAVATAAMVLGSAIGPALSGALIDAGLTFPEQTPYVALYFVAAAMLASVGVLGHRHRLPPMVAEV